MTLPPDQFVGLLLFLTAAVGQPSFADKNTPVQASDSQGMGQSSAGYLGDPVAGLNVRPGHFSEAEYYRAPIDNYRTYPVYAPGREPAGYWEMLQTGRP